MPIAEKKILVVDDDPHIARLLEGLLASRQYSVDIAKTGDAALLKAQHCPDIILLDRTLPDMEGLEICRRIREDKRLRQIPIVVLSGRNTSLDKIEGLYVGADDYVTKPFDNEELVARLEAVLRRSRFSEYVVQEKEHLLAEVKRILAEGDITTFFQPIFSLATGRPLGFEALSRPPVNGPVSNPEILFRAALSYGMYFDLEMLCWHRAFAKWRAASPDGRLFLNCMPYLVEHEKFPEDVFRDEAIAAPGLVLEMTERMAIHDYALFHSKIGGLKRTGLGIAIDDVGNGYASLDAIAETEPDYVKIDMNLIRAIETAPLKQGIVEAIVGFCRKNNITTIAEGVERKEELITLKALGVHAVQGYLLASPSRKIATAFDFDPAILRRQ